MAWIIRRARRGRSGFDPDPRALPGRGLGRDSSAAFFDELGIRVFMESYDQAVALAQGWGSQVPRAANSLIEDLFSLGFGVEGEELLPLGDHDLTEFRESGLEFGPIYGKFLTVDLFERLKTVGVKKLLRFAT